jgi:hypothetical protein
VVVEGLTLVEMSEYLAVLAVVEDMLITQLRMLVAQGRLVKVTLAVVATNKVLAVAEVLVQQVKMVQIMALEHLAELVVMVELV